MLAARARGAVRARPPARLFVLCDEAYFDVRYDGSSRSFASLPGMQERSVILYTFSKKYAMTGWRLGAAIGPRWFIDICNTLNVNGESCTNQFVQWGGAEALPGDQSGARADPRGPAATPRRRLRHPELHRRSALPAAQHDLLPVSQRHRSHGRAGLADYEDFRRAILGHTGVSMSRACIRTGARRRDQRYLRFAYSGLHTDSIREGLGLLKTFIEGRE